MPHMNERLIFYHIPKTGGRWVLTAMQRAGVPGIGRAPRIRGIYPFGLSRHHATPLAISDEHKKDRFQFCFVRRPVEWYRSFWCYRVQSQHLDPNFPLDKCWAEEYEPFLENVLTAYPDGFVTQIYKCYVGADNTWMDFVGRQENLVDDLVTALNLAGETIDEKRLRRLKPMNVSAGIPQFADRAIASPSMVERIESTERWVLDTFYEGKRTA